jgi:hypothetical protein
VANASFIENVAAGVDTLGVKYAPIIYGLAQVQWESPEDRDAVLSFLAGGTNG